MMIRLPLYELLSQLSGLRIEDWDDHTIKTFMEALKEYKATAEAFASKTDDAVENTANNKQL